MHSGWTELDILHEARSSLLQPVFLETEQCLQILGGQSVLWGVSLRYAGDGAEFHSAFREFLCYEKLHDGGYGLGF